MKVKVYKDHIIDEGFDYNQFYFVVPELNFVFWSDGDTVKTGKASSYSYDFEQATSERRAYRMQSLEDLEAPDELIAKLREYQATQKILEEGVEGLEKQRRGDPSQ